MPRISIGTLANIMMTAALALGAPPKIGDRAPLVKYLRENFGVTMDRVSEPATYEVLVLSPRNEAD